MRPGFPSGASRQPLDFWRLGLRLPALPFGSRSLYRQGNRGASQGLSSAAAARENDVELNAQRLSIFEIESSHP